MTSASQVHDCFVCVCCKNSGWLQRYGICPLCDGAVNIVGELTDPTAAPTGGEPLLPEAGRRNVLVTAALPYVNNVPHLGNIIGCVLSADVYARYCRSRGYQTLFIGGTDEYGTATEIKALEEGVTPREICDKYHAIHADIYKWFGISFDKFGRTSNPLQTEIVQSVFRKVATGGWLKEDVIEQLYSQGLERFLADRYVEGTCPKCGFAKARGDQCDSCRSLLNPAELKDPRCKFTGTTPVVRTSNHLYLDLPKLEGQLREFVAESSDRGGWSSNARSVTKDWLNNVGLQPRCITRDLKWGVPVPEDVIKGFQDKVFYVWFDAPIGYISITADYTPDWEQWWRAPQDVELTQFLGKDNILFHSLIFPASLLATGEKWTLVNRISATEYLKYEDSKFSKSESVGVFGDNARDTEIEADVWRYYLLAVRPEQGDSEFRWSDLAAKNNGELVNNLGNFCHRVLDFASKNYGSVAPCVCDSALQECADLGRELQQAVDIYIEHLEACRLREGLKAALEISSIGNKFLHDHEPWKLIKTDPARAGSHVTASLGVVRLLAALLSPFTPSVATRYLQYLGLDSSFGQLSAELLAAVGSPHTLVPPRHVLGPKPAHVFTRISPDQVEAFRKRFAGNADAVREKLAAKKNQQKVQKEKRKNAQSLPEASKAGA